MNKKMREIRAKIEALHNEGKVLLDAKNLDQAEAKCNEIDALEKEYTLAARLFREEKAAIPEAVIEESKKKGVVDFVKAFADGIRQIKNGMSEGSDTDGGYTVPEDVRTKVEQLRGTKFSLEQLVSTESVSTNAGKRTFKRRSDQAGFTLVGEGSKIGQKTTPQFKRIEYVIKKYAGILPVTNELFEDSDANIYGILTEWLADESRVTRNKLILGAINTNAAVEIIGLDGIKKTLNITLGQAFKPTSHIITNDDGLQYLDTLKDSDGKYLLQPSPANPMQLVLCAGATTTSVKVIPNADLVTVGNKVPFIIGDLKEGIRFFDRKRMNLLQSNTAVSGTLNAFEEDLTFIRAIEREDVVVRDSDAFVNGYITVPNI